MFVVSALTLAILGWAYATTFIDIGERWATDPQYTHGFLVPLFAGYLLWWNRTAIGNFQPRWWGAGVVFLGAAMRLASHLLYQPWLDSLSLLVVLAGIAVAAGGRRALVWAAPAICFLAFMLPMPYRFQAMLGGTLQRVATFASTYVLQTLGVPAVAEGNVIVLPNDRLGVVEACNGLSMLVTFFALAAGVAILAKRTWVERVLILLTRSPSRWSRMSCGSV